MMEIDENEIISFIEPVYRFCVRRVSNRHDAEDLASEIMMYILNGIKQYNIDSLESWVWRIARNRYARFIDSKSKNREVFSENVLYSICDDYDYDIINKIIIEEEHYQIFKYLHSLSSEYRNIMVGYYIEQYSVKQISEIYNLSQATVKWRLNVSRKKIKTRIEESNMETINRIYKRINWNTTTCNGSMDSDKYLHSQIARAICEAAYIKPLTIDEISLKTGLPAMYIEDELPRLINGDAIVKEGAKYYTNFIILHLCDKNTMITKFQPLIKNIADYFEKVFKECEIDVVKMDFYGSKFGMKRLGYIALPAVMRCKMCSIIDDLNLDEGPIPPRLDGGYGWFLVDETETEEEKIDDTAIGSNNWGDSNIQTYYFWIGKYFNNDVYQNHGTRWIWENKIIEKANNGIIPNDALTDDDRIKLIKNNLIIKDRNEYMINFPVFEREQFDIFFNYFYQLGEQFDSTLSEIISDIHKSFKSFVPKQLNNQINVWVKYYSYNMIGFVAEELIKRNVLETPGNEKPLTNGVFCVRNKGDLKI